MGVYSFLSHYIGTRTPDICRVACVIMIVADALAPNRLQGISNNHTDSTVIMMLYELGYAIRIAQRPLNKLCLRKVRRSATCHSLCYGQVNLGLRYRPACNLLVPKDSWASLQLFSIISCRHPIAHPWWWVMGCLVISESDLCSIIATAVLSYRVILESVVMRF